MRVLRADLLRHGIGQRGREGAGPLGEGEDVGLREGQARQQEARGHEIVVHLVREAGHEIAAEPQSGHEPDGFLDERFDVAPQVGPAHGREDAVRARLHGDVQEAADVRPLRHERHGRPRDGSGLERAEAEARRRAAEAG